MVSIVNPTRQVLAAGGISAGVGIRGVRGIEVAKVMKTAGYDFLFIDLEHGSMSIETACSISVAALDAGITPLVRVPHMDLQLATRCLDGGALGIVVPHVDTADEARCHRPEKRHQGGMVGAPVDRRRLRVDADHHRDRNGDRQR